MHCAPTILPTASGNRGVPASCRDKGRGWVEVGALCLSASGSASPRTEPNRIVLRGGQAQGPLPLQEDGEASIAACGWFYSSGFHPGSPDQTLTCISYYAIVQIRSNGYDGDTLGISPALRERHACWKCRRRSSQKTPLSQPVNHLVVARFGMHPL